MLWLIQDALGPQGGVGMLWANSDALGPREESWDALG